MPGEVTHAVALSEIKALSHAQSRTHMHAQPAVGPGAVAVPINAVLRSSLPHSNPVAQCPAVRRAQVHLWKWCTRVMMSGQNTRFPWEFGMEMESRSGRSDAVQYAVNGVPVRFRSYR